MATAFSMSVVNAKAVINSPKTNMAIKGVCLFGCNLARTNGRSWFRLIANVIRDRPSKVVKSTLIVAANAPTVTRLAMKLPSKAAASANGEFVAPNEAEPTVPMATNPTSK